MNISEEEKVIIKKKIIRYVNLLYKFLGDKYCFTSGAFVIQDNDYKLYKLLSLVIDVDLTGMYIKTHTIFKDNNEKMYEIHFPELSFKSNIICKCQDNKFILRKMQNIKFYKFTNNNNKLIYLKLEDYPTFDKDHIFQGFNRYVLNDENKSCVLPRREDCNHEKRKNCNYYKDESTKNYINNNPLFTLNKNDSNKENFNPNIDQDNIDKDDILLDLNEEQEPVTVNTELKKSYDIVKINNEECNISETYVRKGDEFFIPYCINDFFINIINNNIEDNYILFEYDNEINTINIRNIKEPNSPTSNKNGGTKKNKKYIRHYSQRKRKQIKRKKQSNKKKKIKIIHRSHKNI